VALINTNTYMTLKQLQAFYWAAKLGSFAIAADRLSISQSSLSKRIAELESSLGEILFARSARRATLTEKGEAILDSTYQMLVMETTLRQRAASLNGVQGLLRFGIGELTAATWFPKFMRSAATNYPDLVIEPLVSQARSMELEVERGTLDCAVIAGHSMRRQLGSQRLCGVTFSWMASPNLKLRNVLLTPDTLRRYPIIAPNSLSGQAQAFNDWLSETGAVVDRVISCNSLNATVELTVAGLGISVLPQRYLQPLLRRKLVVRLKSEPDVPSLYYCFIWRSDDTRPLISSIKKLVIDEVDFNLATPLWQ
jgi:DNA-binding transcriptional LysR family regulator